MGQYYAIGVLALILCMLYLLQSYLMKIARSFPPNKISASRTGKKRYAYKATLTINGVMSRDFIKRATTALEGIGGVRAEVDVLGEHIIVHMKRSIHDDMLRSAVESLGSHTVLKITR